MPHRLQEILMDEKVGAVQPFNVWSNVCMVLCDLCFSRFCFLYFSIELHSRLTVVY
jgi:hypothetical protein